MKSIYVCTIGACIMLSAAGCIKSNEYLLRLDDIGKFCKLKTLIVNGPDTVAFHYNSYGDPDSAVYQHGSTTPNLYFRYDSRHRIQDYIYGFSDRDSAVFWFRYYYASDTSKQAFADSLYIYPDQMTHFPPHAAGPAYDNYTYDSLGRITHLSVIHDEEYFNFAYDAHGNITPNGLNGPDDKVNYNRTSKVFQFLNWDYSVNNPFIATKYNRFGLPTEIDLTGKGSIRLFQVITYTTAKMEYDCK